MKTHQPVFSCRFLEDICDDKSKKTGNKYRKKDGGCELVGCGKGKILDRKTGKCINMAREGYDDHGVNKMKKYIKIFNETGKTLDPKILDKYLKDNRYNVDKKFIPALAKLLMDEDLGMDDIMDTSRGNYGYGQIISFGRNGPDWWFVTDKDADKAVEEDIKNTIDDVGLESFNYWEDFIDKKKAENYFRKVYTEWDESYADDIENESAWQGDYENRLEQEMADWGAKNKNDFVKKLVDDKIKEGNGGFDHYKDNFGEEEANKLLIDEDLIDIPSYIKFAIRTDGRGNFLSPVDGEEHEYKGVCYYRTN